MSPSACLSCGSPDQRLVVSLGEQPLANSYLKAAQLDAREPRFPLDVYFCGACHLVHIEPMATSEEIFSDYAYFSSFSDSWLAHSQRYVERMVPRLGLGPDSRVIEIASNDGYLLQYFVAAGVPCLGIEPAANVAAEAVRRGVPTEVAFWGVPTAERVVADGGPADLILGNNVLAHVPDLNDFVGGVATALAPTGTVTFEFPHLLRLLSERQFDTIYHEHFSYFSLAVVQGIFARHGLEVFDVEQLATHGGSLRVFGRPAADTSRPVSDAVREILARELAEGLDRFERYARFATEVAHVRDGVLGWLDEARATGRRVAAYGAPAKGNTLLNYCGVTAADIPYTVDRSPHKQGLWLPGSRIPIRAPSDLLADQPDDVLVLPWNLADEIVDQMSAVRAWGGRFLVAIPTLRVL